VLQFGEWNGRPRRRLLSFFLGSGEAFDRRQTCGGESCTPAIRRRRQRSRRRRRQRRIGDGAPRSCSSEEYTHATYTHSTRARTRTYTLHARTRTAHTHTHTRAHRCAVADERGYMAARVLLLSVLITEVLKPACAAGACIQCFNLRVNVRS